MIYPQFWDKPTYISPPKGTCNKTGPFANPKGGYEEAKIGMETTKSCLCGYGSNPRHRVFSQNYGWLMVDNSNFTMVYGTQITIVTGANKPTNITGGPHIVVFMRVCSSIHLETYAAGGK